MNDFDNSSDELERAVREMGRCLFDTANQLQELKEVRTDAFEHAEQWMQKVALLLKGRDSLPRKPLLLLRQVGGILENEAPYAKDPKSALAMANSVAITLDLVLRGEAHDDRKPGVPRII
jgi:hypothetical protein